MKNRDLDKLSARLDSLFGKGAHAELLTVEERMILGLPTTEEERLNWVITSKKYLQERY